MAEQIRVLALPRYSRLGASSRLRTLQYIPRLRALGYSIQAAPLFDDAYVIGLYAQRISKVNVISSYLKRVHALLGSRDSYDLIWIEKELLPWLPAWVERMLLRSDTPWVLDYDDAVFHRYDSHRTRLVRKMLGRKIDALMRRAEIVVCGNSYLADRASSAGARIVEILPTVIDLERYTLAENSRDHGTEETTIGWIGSPLTSRYLDMVAPAVKEVAKRHPVRFTAVGAGPLPDLGCTAEGKPWLEQTEVLDITRFDIGIMPLPDAPFERGKCGYKLIQYMACGKPVVASPVGANKQIVRHGVDGFLAETTKEWIDALAVLCSDASLRLRFGASGRRRVAAEYSVDSAAPRLDAILKSALRSKHAINGQTAGRATH